MTKLLDIIFKTMSYGLLTLVLVLILFIAISGLVANIATAKSADYWIQYQLDHISDLEESYANNTADKIDEGSLADFDVSDENLANIKYNEFRTLATHNSYKSGLVKETDFLYNIAIPFILGKQYDYIFDPISEQLNQGVRSFELDINQYSTDDGLKFRCVHNPAFEQNSTMIDFELGLKEIKMWSDYNPDHMPISIMIEAKGSSGDFKKLDEKGLVAFDALAKDIFGDSLIQAGDWLGDFDNFAEFREANAYPSLLEMKGKVLFYLSSQDVIEEYIDMDPTMKSHVMFSNITKKAERSNQYLSERTLFLVLNNETDEEQEIKDYISEGNFIIRTRPDKFGTYPPERLERAINSGAHILSTDYPPSDSGRYDYLCKVTPSGKTMFLSA